MPELGLQGCIPSRFRDEGLGFEVPGVSSEITVYFHESVASRNNFKNSIGLFGLQFKEGKHGLRAQDLRFRIQGLGVIVLFK